MNASSANVYAVILAAGASRRLGKPKQLLEWRDRTLLEHAIQNARPLLNERIIVVLGAHAQAIQSAVQPSGIHMIVNPNWQEGIASSIRTGIGALPASASAALILLCDQPLINTGHLQSLLIRWQNEPTCIVASHYFDSVGVPALFPAHFFGPLLELEGDRGAKHLLQKFSSGLRKIPLPEAELDIDSASDFDHLTGTSLLRSEP